MALALLNEVGAYFELLTHVSSIGPSLFCKVKNCTVADHAFIVHLLKHAWI